MRLILPVLVLVFVLTAAGNAADVDGAAVFTSLKCGMCHKPDKKAAAVSLAEIGRAYMDKEKLVQLFKGDLKPLIESDKWGMMRPQLDKIKALPDPEKDALAGYVMGFK
jgi:cytochrome c551/c552